MHRRLFVVIVLLAAAGVCRAQDDPYSIIERAYAPYMAKDDPFAFSMKISAISESPYRLWYGGKDLFFNWCKTNVPAAWLEDHQGYITQHGDQHLGNIGTYLARGEFGTMAFGMVDFDDSHRLPVQFELLQGIITFRLTADQNGVQLTDGQWKALIALIFTNYREAAASSKTATELLAGEPLVQRMLQRRTKRTYVDELAEYTDGAGHFIRDARNRKGEVRNILRPVDDPDDAVARGIAEAIEHSPRMQRAFRIRGVNQVKGAIKDIALRTRPGSSGSQGLRKYFVLLRRPIVGVNHDVIFYLKEEIPTAAERSGIIPQDSRPPGRRTAEDLRSLTDPKPYLLSWCSIGGKSYWITTREPWSDELDPDEAKDADRLMDLARIWGTATGASHHGSGQADVIAQRITPELAGDLDRLSEAFCQRLKADFDKLRSDPRVARHLAAAQQVLSAAAPVRR